MFNRFLNNLKRRYQSLIARILLYFVLSALTVAIVLGWNLAQRIKPQFEQQILPNLSQYIQYLVLDIGSPPDLARAAELSQRLPFELRIEGPGVDWSSNILLEPVARYRFKPAPYPYQQYQIAGRKADHLLMLEKGGYRYLFAIESSFRNSARNRHWVLFVLLAGILGLLYFGIRRMFRPLTEISSHLEKIGAGQLDESIEIRGHGELAELADGINRMRAEIKSMLESKAGMLLAISHELRSPITRMRVNLELLATSDLQQTLIDDVKEMEELVASLLESEKLNSRHAILNRSTFDLSTSIRDLIDQHFSDCPINQHLPPTVAYLDEIRIRLLVKNLLDNACRYSIDSNKAVEISLEQQDEWIQLEIIDHGPGVDIDDLGHITEPFYRSDSARQRKTGGYGLGLYLCRLIAEAHGGKLQFESGQGEGFTVKLQLPISTEAAA